MIETVVDCTEYAPLLSEVIAQRGERRIKDIAPKLSGKWGMASCSTIQTIQSHLEDGSAWGRLALRGYIPDKMHPNRTTTEVRCEHMRDYLRAIGFSKAEQIAFFNKLSKIHPTFRYPSS